MERMVWMKKFVVMNPVKAIPLEAVQFNKIGDHHAVTEDATSPTGFSLKNRRSTRRHLVAPGDWIVTESFGSYIPLPEKVMWDMYHEATPEEIEAYAKS